MPKTVSDYMRQHDDAVASSLRISHNQISKIVVYSLLKRYKNNLKNENALEIAAFETVLLYYLSEKELTKIKEKTTTRPPAASK